MIEQNGAAPDLTTGVPPQQAENRSMRIIDPQNPFENPLENRAYRCDYRRILPQILLPGFQIPLFPEKSERCAIRRQMNVTGFWVFLNCFCNQLLFLVIMLVLLLVMDGTTSSYFTGNLEGAYGILRNSASFMALHCVVFAGLNVLTAWLGCRQSNISVESLFRTTNFSAWHAVQYIWIGIALQFIAGWAYTLLETIFTRNGSSLTEPMEVIYQDGKTMVIGLLYTCVLAPITEELFYRGFVMKSLSKIGVRFGIVVSALLFGMMHGNFSQAILGTILGLFLGKITMRHNSLVPSILVHMGLNVSASIFTILGQFSGYKATFFLYVGFTLLYFGMVVAGIVFWMLTERKQPLPYPTQKQAARQRVFWTSPVLLLTFAFLIAFVLMFGIAW